MEDGDVNQPTLPANRVRPVEPIEAASVRLRLVEVEDAAFIIRLRSDPRISRHLSMTDVDVSRQEEWLRRYLERESRGEEYYFIIEAKDGQAVGTIRLYDIDGVSFRSGSWIAGPDAPTFGALEAVIVLYDFGFYRLGLEKAVFDVRRANRPVLRFHRRFGAKEVRSNELDFFFELTKQDYEKARPVYARLLESES